MLRKSIIGLILSLWAEITAATVIQVVAEEHFPLNGPEQGSMLGYGVDLLQEIFAREGLEVEYKVVSRSRAISLVRLGQADCVLGIHSEEAQDFIFPEASIGASQEAAYTLRPNPWCYRGVSSLQGRKVAVEAGSYYDKGLLDAYLASRQKPSFVEISQGPAALELNLQKLLAKRVEVVLANRMMMQAKLREKSLIGVVEDAGAINKARTLYLACSPAKESSLVFTRMFSEGIERLRTSGQLREIMARYGLEDWKE